PADRREKTTDEGDFRMTDATSSAADTIESREEIFRDSGTVWRYWENALDVAGKQEKAWRDDADKAVKLYRAERKHRAPFNILHSNVETIVPSLYNSTPDPDVRTRNGDRNEIARQGAQLLERGIRYQLDE